MGLLAKLFPAPVSAVSSSPWDDHWYTDLGASAPTAAGVRITQETALSIATVFACCRIISSAHGMLPLLVYRRVGDGGKERAGNHPLYDLLHDAPNARQNSYQWRQTLMTHLLLRGNAYCEIRPGPRGPIDQLLPLDPSRMEVELLESGRLRYRYNDPNSMSRAYTQDEVFHVAGLSCDGVKGLSVLQHARESMGLTYAAETFGARLFSQGALHKGVLTHPGALKQEGRDALKEELRQHYSGLGNAHKTMLLQEGMTWQSISITPEDAQFLATRGFQVEETASWFGVPLSLLQHTEKSTSWGTGISQLTLGFLLYTLQPWLTLWEQSVSQQLILNRERYFAEFLVEGLLRGDSQARASFYATMIQWGVLTRNEVRVRENLNPLDGLDDPLTPLNMGGSSEEPAEDNQRLPPPEPPQEEDEAEEAAARARAATIPDKYYSKALSLALDAAGRLVHKETTAIRKEAKKRAADPEAWGEWVDSFYQTHQGDMAEQLRLSPECAQLYCDKQRKELLSGGLTVTEQWEKQQPAALAALMLTGEE